ncbi:MAG: amidohydrolase family protein [Armatimonadota bacterium]
MKKILIICLLFIGIATFAFAEEPMKYEIVDAHVHYVDFAQNTDGVDVLLKCMDHAKVTDAVLWGLPVIKIWGCEKKQPVHSLDSETRMYWDTKTDYLIAAAYLNATDEQKKRLHPFMCGFNGNDKNSLDQVKRLIQTYPGLWQGIGEIFAHHDYISYMTSGEIPRPDSDAYDMIYKFAAKYDMPVVIHNNITSGSNPKPIYLEQMMNAVRNNPKTKFVWAHIGISNDIYIPNLQDIISEQLGKYPNLNVDLSWLVWDYELDPSMILDKKWLPVIEKYPDRFTLGTDIVGRFMPLEKYKSEIRKYDVLLNDLTPETARKVAHDNFFKLLPKQPVILKPEDRIQM